MGAGGISCQMCNKIKSSWWPDTSIQECLKGYKGGFMESLFLAPMENACSPPQTKLAKMLTNVTQRKDFTFLNSG